MQPPLPPQRRVARTGRGIVFLPPNVSAVCQLFPPLKGRFAFVSLARVADSHGATLDSGGASDAFQLLFYIRRETFSCFYAANSCRALVSELLSAALLAAAHFIRQKKATKAHAGEARTAV